MLYDCMAYLSKVLTEMLFDMELWLYHNFRVFWGGVLNEGTSPKTLKCASLLKDSVFICILHAYTGIPPIHFVESMF